MEENIIPCCGNCCSYTGAPGGHCMNNGKIRKPGEWCPAWEESICSDGACDLEEESNG